MYVRKLAKLWRESFLSIEGSWFYSIIYLMKVPNQKRKGLMKEIHV